MCLRLGRAMAQCAEVAFIFKGKTWNIWRSGVKINQTGSVWMVFGHPAVGGLVFFRALSELSPAGRTRTLHFAMTGSAPFMGKDMVQGLS